MKFSDKTLICVDCGEEFVFSAGEQIFFREKQFEHEPKRCKKCKAKRGNIRARVETAVICAECGTSTIVPFVPREDRPVLCRVCLYRSLQRLQQQSCQAALPAQLSEQVEAIQDRSQGLAGGGKLVT
jgi:CxxC-x17-CxxC domain-containing protein